MYQLHYASGACSMAVHVVLNEVGQNVELIKVDMQSGAHKSPEFLKINPRGQVPVLIEDGKVLREGAAQITYLCDKYKSSLLPSEGWARAEALQWLMFANSSLHVGYSKAMFCVRTGGSEEQIGKACDDIQSMWDMIENHLSTTGNTYLCGNTVTCGDIVVAVIANWGFLPRQFTLGAKTKALLNAVIARPSYQKAIAAEGVEYKAAA